MFFGAGSSGTHGDPAVDLERRGFYRIDMDQVSRLIRFSRTNSQVQGVFDICFNSMLTDRIDVTSPSHPATEAQLLARSRIWGNWSRQAAEYDAAIGFFVASFSETNEIQRAETGMSRAPILIDLDVVRVFHRSGYKSDDHQWAVLVPRPSENGSRGSEWDVLPPELFRVIGTRMPTTDGRLQSKMLTIMTREFEQYMNKHHMTMEADRLLLRPKFAVQAPPSTHNASGNGVHADRENHDFTLMGDNDGCDDSRQLAAREQNRRNLDPDDDEYDDESPRIGMGGFIDIPRGKVYVAAHQPRVPLELQLARQAFMEVVSLSFSVPIGMISEGDATGRPRLNRAAVSPETSRVFYDAQNHRKRLLEHWIISVCELMFGDETMIKNIDKHLTQQAAAAANTTVTVATDLGTAVSILASTTSEKKRRRVVDPEQVVRDVQWSVQVATTLQIDQILELQRLGLLADGSVNRLLSARTGVHASHFAPVQALSDEQKIIYGCQPNKREGEKKRTREDGEDGRVAKKAKKKASKKRKHESDTDTSESDDEKPPAVEKKKKKSV